MSSKYMHMATDMSADLEPLGLGFTYCGKMLSLNGAPLGAPQCPDCLRVAERKGWWPYSKQRKRR